MTDLAFNEPVRFFLFSGGDVVADLHNCIFSAFTFLSTSVCFALSFLTAKDPDLKSYGLVGGLKVFAGEDRGSVTLSFLFISLKHNASHHPNIMMHFCKL